MLAVPGHTCEEKVVSIFSSDSSSSESSAPLPLPIQKTPRKTQQQEAKTKGQGRSAGQKPTEENLKSLAKSMGKSATTPGKVAKKKPQKPR